MISQAYALTQGGRWEEALPLAKRYALDHPMDPSGHFLLGLAYANRYPPLYALAVGEFEVALALEQASGDIGELREEVNEQDFLFRAYEQLALAQITWIVQAREIGVPTKMVVPRLHQALDAVNRGLAIDSDAEFLRQLKERIEYYLDKYGHLDPRVSEVSSQTAG